MNYDESAPQSTSFHIVRLFSPNSQYPKYSDIDWTLQLSCWIANGAVLVQSHKKMDLDSLALWIIVVIIFCRPLQIFKWIINWTSLITIILSWHDDLLCESGGEISFKYIIPLTSYWYLNIVYVEFRFGMPEAALNLKCSVNSCNPDIFSVFIHLSLWIYFHKTNTANNASKSCMLEKTTYGFGTRWCSRKWGLIF